MSLTTPKGFSRIEVAAYFDGDELVLTGEPPEEEGVAGEPIHHCDSLGCGWEHVLARATIHPAYRDQLRHLMAQPLSVPPVKPGPSEARLKAMAAQKARAS
jgi:hypothetical protein